MPRLRSPTCTNHIREGSWCRALFLSCLTQHDRPKFSIVLERAGKRPHGEQAGGAAVWECVLLDVVVMSVVVRGREVSPAVARTQGHSR